eukprot:scaffold5064_cov121-Cylindrotheca_fusiformis.AAC.6
MLSKEEYTNGWNSISEQFPKSGWLPASKGGFWKGFTAGFSMIIATEIGDRTFFICAIMSMRQKRSAVFAGAVLSCYIMTVLSTIVGLVLPAMIPVKYTHILGGFLFLYFGFKLVLDSRKMDSHKVSEELEEAEEELSHPKKDEESGQPDSSSSSPLRTGFAAVAVQSFSLTFFGEWGDRSQIATIALAAAKNPYGVTLGGCIGHTVLALLSWVDACWRLEFPRKRFPSEEVSSS